MIPAHRHIPHPLSLAYIWLVELYLFRPRRDSIKTSRNQNTDTNCYVSGLYAMLPLYKTTRTERSVCCVSGWSLSLALAGIKALSLLCAITGEMFQKPNISLAMFDVLAITQMRCSDVRGLVSYRLCFLIPSATANAWQNRTPGRRLGPQL